MVNVYLYVVPAALWAPGGLEMSFYISGVGIARSYLFVFYFCYSASCRPSPAIAPTAKITTLAGTDPDEDDLLDHIGAAGFQITAPT